METKTTMNDNNQLSVRSVHVGALCLDKGDVPNTETTGRAGKLSRNQEIRALKREMRQRGIRVTSCMNGGLTPDEYRYNSQLMQLKWSK